MKKVIAIILAATLMILLGSSMATVAKAAEDTGQTWEFICAFTKNEAAVSQFTAACDRISERTNGRVTFEYFYSGAQVNAADMPRALEMGTADIGDLVMANYTDYFPISSLIMDLPFLGITDKSIFAFDQLYQEFPEIEEEYKAGNIHYLGHALSTAQNLLLVKDVDIHQLSDLNGLKILTNGNVEAQLLKDGGGAAVQANFPDYYTNLSTGLADGLLGHLCAWNSIGAVPLSGRIIFFGDDVSCSFNRLFCGWYMNLDKWNSLTPEIQEIFNEEMAQFEQDEYLYRLSDEKKALDQLYEQNTPMNFLTEEEVASFKDDIAGKIIEEVENLDSMGLPGTAMYERLIEIIDELNNQ